MSAKQPLKVHSQDKKRMYYDYIGISPYGTKLAKSLIAVADRKVKERLLYVVHRTWVNLLTGQVTCPYPVSSNAKVAEDIVRMLLSSQYPAHTMVVPLSKKNYKIMWKDHDLRGVYAHFDLNDLQAAYEFCDSFSKGDEKSVQGSLPAKRNVVRKLPFSESTSVLPLRTSSEKGIRSSNLATADNVALSLPKKRTFSSLSSSTLANADLSLPKKSNLFQNVDLAQPINNDDSVNNVVANDDVVPVSMTRINDDGILNNVVANDGVVQVSMSVNATSLTSPQSVTSAYYNDNDHPASISPPTAVRASVFEKNVMERLIRLEARLESFYEEDREYKKTVTEFLLSHSSRHPGPDNNVATPTDNDDSPSLSATLARKYDFPLSLDRFKEMNSKLGDEEISEDVKQFIALNAYSASPIKKLVKPEVVRAIEKKDFVEASVMKLYKDYVATNKNIVLRTLKTPPKYKKLGLRWRQIPREEKVECVMYRWYRTKREQKKGKNADDSDAAKVDNVEHNERSQDVVDEHNEIVERTLEKENVSEALLVQVIDEQQYARMLGNENESNALIQEVIMDDEQQYVEPNSSIDFDDELQSELDRYNKNN